MLEEVEGKAVIWAHYQYDVQTIMDAIKKEYGNDSIVDYYGKTPNEVYNDDLEKNNMALAA